jgi:hypothetical protein
MSYGSGPHLSTDVGSGAAMCPIALNLISQLRWAPALPRVLWLRTLPPSQGESWCCHASRCHQWVMGLRYIKKGLARLPMQLGSCVSKSHVHVLNAPDVRAIMDLQDMWTGGTFNACKTCGQTTIVQLQCSVDPVDHSQGTARVPDDPIARCHVAD